MSDLVQSRSMASRTWCWMFCRITEKGQPTAPLFFRRKKDAEGYIRDHPHPVHCIGHLVGRAYISR